MAATFAFELVSPERILISFDAEQVVLPGTEGEFTVLPGHAPVIATLRPGLMTISSGGSVKKMLVKGGFADVQPETLTVLAPNAQDVAELTAAKLADEMASAEALRAEAKDDDGRLTADALIDTLKGLQAN